MTVPEHNFDKQVAAEDEADENAEFSGPLTAHEGFADAGVTPRNIGDADFGEAVGE